MIPVWICILQDDEYLEDRGWKGEC